MSASMSTSIDDLPGPLPQELTRELRDDLGSISNRLDNSFDLKVQPNDTNIRANVKKRVSFVDEQEDQDTLSSFKNEINEENVLLLAILVATALPSFNKYVQQIPFVGSYATSDFTTSIIKAVVMVIVFILLKIFILPKLKL